MLAVLILLTMPASAYSLSIPANDPDDIQLSYTSSEARSLATTGASAAAQKVMNLAEENDMTVNRSVQSIRNEIRAHALAYMAGETDRSNPMDLVMSEGEWDWFWNVVD